MKKNIYKEKILERLRLLHEEETMLYEILNSCKGKADENSREENENDIKG